MDQENKQKEVNSDDSYFKLIEAVGSRGRYQKIMVILACLLCFQNGFVSLGTPYYFAVAPYTNCPPQYSGITECTKYACSLPYQQRLAFEQPQISQLKTLGNQYGDYHCGGASDVLGTVKGAYFLGGFIGVIITSSLADNIGRRPTLLISLVAGVLGHIIIQFAGNLWTAGAGMFMVGVCVQSCYNIAVCLLSEILPNSERQKKTALIQAFFCFSGIVAVAVFYIFKSWRIIFIMLLLIPLSACLVFCFFFVQETPQFLIKRYQVKDIRKSLRFIAKINKTQQGFDDSDILGEQNIKKLKEQYQYELKQSDKKALTYLDLFRYRSLRKITLLMMVIFASINILYYAPLMLIDEFGFDFYLNGIIINSSEFLTYFFSYFLITKIKRRKFNILGSGIALVTSFALIFLHTKQICTQDCWNARNIMQLLMIFVMRFFVSFMFQVLFIYITELYPTQVIGLAIGMTGTAGALPVMIIPELINVIDRSNFPVMIIFLMVAIFYLISSWFLEETHGRRPQQKILQIQKGIAMGRESDRVNDIELVQEQDK